MEAQETNINLTDFRIPKIYIDGEWKEFPDYKINRDGSKIYSLKTNKYRTLQTASKDCKTIMLIDTNNKTHNCTIAALIWFTFEYENLDLSGCKVLYYNNEYYPRYLVNNNGTIIFDTRTKKVLRQSFRGNKPKHKENSTATKYCVVWLHLGDKHRSVFVHQLVKWTFKGGPETELKPPIIDPTVDHIDGNGLNNDINNLQWLDRGFNTAKGTSGINNGMAVLDNNIARQICVELQYADLSMSLRDIADEFGVSIEIIRHIYAGKTWRGISQKYMPFPERVKKYKKKERV